jgi:hypothetical protein
MRVVAVSCVAVPASRLVPGLAGGWAGVRGLATAGAVGRSPPIHRRGVERYASRASSPVRFREKDWVRGRNRGLTIINLRG